MDKFDRYRKAVKFLEGLANLSYKYYARDKHGDKSLYLRRMRYFLNLLGNPDKGIKYVHVTGTAGKGSVSNLMQKVLMQAGYKTGLFTSPFVTTTIEKIKVNDLYISPNEFADLVDQVKPAIDKAYAESPYGGPAYFEVLIAMGFLYFKKQKCDWAVLEVGMGGRFDATNVIEKKQAAIITNIDYDHTETLGRTLSKIAWEKAGIIKRGAVMWTTEQRPHLLKIFKKECKKQGVKLNSIKDGRNGYGFLNKELVKNVSLELGISEQAVARGLKSARPLPARFERMPQKFPAVFIDGAHNERKIETTLQNLKEQKYRKLHLVMAFAKSKDYIPMLEEFLPLAHNIVFTRFETPLRKTADPADLVRAARAKRFKGKLSMSLDPMVALDRALRSAGKNDLVLCTGSFFMAGRVREHWFPEEWILQHRRSF